MQNTLSTIKSLKKDLSSSIKRNDSLKAESEEKDEVIKAQQEEINKLRGKDDNARKDDMNRSNNVEKDKNSNQVRLSYINDILHVLFNTVKLFKKPITVF